MNIHDVSAQPTTDCSKLVTGTYLTTQSGNFGSFRGLMTLTPDGNFVYSGSNQNVAPSALDPSVPAPYGNALGSWKCTSDTEITGTSLNFTYPTATLPGAIARGDFRAKFDQSGIVQATSTVKSFNLNADPLNDDAPVTGTVTFTGQHVIP
ncbi:hypothetical protein [Nostoc sp.]|uniref:hypothetical protein n=1 Tax=Nostoc sp. TaxID=1180 RepID=UPI002FF66F6D